MQRRQVFAATALMLATGLAAPLGHAQAQTPEWPSQPITLIVPFAPGGATDIVGRIAADHLGKILGQTVIVENKGGAGGALGMADLARAKPDGHTFALITDSIPIQPLVNKSLTWSMDEFKPVAKIATSPEVLVVHSGVPARTVRDFVEFAKSKPEELTYAASSTGSVHHLAGEVFKRQTGIEMIHIPYKGGGQSLVDMAAGRVDAGFIGLAPVLGQLQSGQLKALALTGAERNSLAPDVPTFNEAGYGEFDIELWIGIVGKKDMPEKAAQGMKDAVNRMLGSETVKKNLREIGFEPVERGNENFAEWLSEQQQRWDRIIDQIGMREG